jgi:hypothetical protein
MLENASTFGESQNYFCTFPVHVRLTLILLGASKKQSPKAVGRPQEDAKIFSPNVAKTRFFATAKRFHIRRSPVLRAVFLKMETAWKAEQRRTFAKNVLAH